MNHLRGDQTHIQEDQEHPNNKNLTDIHSKYNLDKNSYRQQTRAKKDKPTIQDTNQKKKNK